jgi:flavodoxin
MRSLVIYDSLFGNTEVIARAIQEGLDERGEAELVTADRVGHADVREAQLIIIGGPTQLKDVTLPLRRIVHGSFRRSWQGKPVAVFDTRFRDDPVQTGSAAAKLAQLLRRRGANLVAPPESFFVANFKGPLVKGEAIRATLWGRSLHLAERVVVDI